MKRYPTTNATPCWAPSRATLPGQKLPFGLRPTTEGARGSDIIIEGIAEDVTVRLDGFRR